MADAEVKNAPVKSVAVPPSAKPKAAPKPKAEPKPPRYALNSTVKMLADKEGKTYGGDNNPKRATTKAHTWFANYKDGMTIAQLIEAFAKTGGSVNSNLDWDIKHGYISVVVAK